MKELLELEPDDCHYPMNEGGPYLFCSDPKREGSNYCAKHHRICWLPARQKAQAYFIRGASA